MIHTVFFDIDGTLVSHETNCVPPSTRRALALLKDKGVRRIIATGRHLSEIESLPMDGLAFDGYLMLNGQLCYDQNKNLIYGNPIEGPSLDALVNIFEKKLFPIMFIEQNRMYINFINNTVRLAQESMSAWMPEVDEYRNNTIYQAVAFVTPEQKELLYKLLPQCRIAQWMELAVDIVPKASGKAAAVDRYLKFLGAERAGTMAFGDGSNDVDMLKFVDVGVAVGNSEAHVQEAADYVTDHIDRDGIYNALLRFGVIHE